MSLNILAPIRYALSLLVLVIIDPFVAWFERRVVACQVATGVPQPPAQSKVGEGNYEEWREIYDKWRSAEFDCRHELLYDNMILFILGVLAFCVLLCWQADRQSQSPTPSLGQHLKTKLIWLVSSLLSIVHTMFTPVRYLFGKSNEIEELEAENKRIGEEVNLPKEEVSCTAAAHRDSSALLYC